MSISPVPAAAPPVMWHWMQAARPLESVVSKISRWMLEKVGVRFGVGPVTSDSFSSQPATAAHSTSTGDEQDDTHGRGPLIGKL